MIKCSEQLDYASKSVGLSYETWAELMCLQNYFAHYLNKLKELDEEKLSTHIWIKISVMK